MYYDIRLGKAHHSCLVCQLSFWGELTQMLLGCQHYHSQYDVCVVTHVLPKQKILKSEQLCTSVHNDLPTQPPYSLAYLMSLTISTENVAEVCKPCR